MKNRLILLRHGQSLFNKKNIFTGWVDVPLSKQGIEEAILAGKQLKDLPIDVIYTSTLIRAQMTACLAMSEHSTTKVPVMIRSEESKEGVWGKVHSPECEKELLPMYIDSRLNERMYGDLQGYNKQATREKFGEKQVHLWRRSYDVRPPQGESLEDNTKRTLPYFQETILPSLEKGYHVLIAAHGNSLRAIVKFLDGLSNEEILGLEIPTGKPLIYEYGAGAFTKGSL